MRPSAALQARIKNRVRFTTKNVGKGFYRGTGTGSLGAHTRYGNYLIDWRKVRHYVVPDLSNTKLTPFVAGSVYKDAELPVDPDGNPYDPKKIDGAYYLRWWKNQNSNEVVYFADSSESSEDSEDSVDSEEIKIEVLKDENNTSYQKLDNATASR